jgi:hypothetical protein
VIRVRRALVAAVVLCGCYRPTDPACVIACTQGAANACPDGFVCGSASLCESANGPTCNGLLDARSDDSSVDPDAVTPDAPIDAPLDGCVASAFSTPSALVVGYMFTVNLAHTRMSLTSGADIRVNESAVDSSSLQDYPVVLMAPGSAVEMYSARMDPTGTIIFVTSDDGTLMSETLVHISRRTGPGAWSAFAPVTMRNGAMGVNLPLATVIGGTTDPSFGPRRLPVFDGIGSFAEYVEAMPNTPTDFVYARTTSANDLGVNLLREPNLTADGLRVVFFARANAIDGIYTSTRASVTAPWTPAVLLHESTVMGSHPYLSNDCRHLYWTELAVGRHAVRL